MCLLIEHNIHFYIYAMYRGIFPPYRTIYEDGYYIEL